MSKPAVHFSLLMRWPVTLLSLLFAPVLFAKQPATPSVSSFTLKNGLHVYVKEDHRAPVTVFQIWYKVGSVDEQPGATGLSHVLEHMMFKGTKAHPSGTFNKIITEYGGEQNASTSNDYTFYYEALDKKHLAVSFELEADRMQNLTFSPDDFTTELQVVKEERRMRTDNDPNGILYERFLAAAFISTPYHYPVIGWMHEIDQLNSDDVRAWYKKWYAPNNANVVVVGDVKPAEVKALAEKYFANIPAREQPKQKALQEIPPLGERRIEVLVPARVPQLLMGFNTPVITAKKDDWEPYALEMLAAVLDGGSSARLEKELVRAKQIATSVNVDYDFFGRLPGLLTISATPTAGTKVADLEQAIMAQCEKIQTQPVGAEELHRAKQQMIASKVYIQDSPSQQASFLGTIVTLGLPWQFYDDYLDKLKQVTAEQIQQVAKKYCQRDRLTVAVLVPQPIDKDTFIPSGLNYKELH